MVSRSLRLFVFTSLLAAYCTRAFIVNPTCHMRSSNLFANKLRTSESETKASKNDVSPWAEYLSKAVACSMIMAAVATSDPLTAFADGQTKEFRLPPIDYADKTRCQLKSSAMGQANAARDKLNDLRQCDLRGSQASGFDLSGVIMTKTDLSNSKFEESYFSKAYMRDSKFDGADFTNAIVDRATFKGSSLRGAIFKNAVLTGTSFEGADVEGADFTEAAFGLYDIRGLCQNPTLKGQNPTTGVDTLESVGCEFK
ncbi:hypothetical protein ACA910_012620 [Epithemia clementina (nom. ined.)]